MQFNPVIPELSVSDFERSLDFYTSRLGFSMVYGRREDQFAFLAYGDCQLMVEQANAHWSVGELQYPYGRGVNFQLAVEDVAPLLQSLGDYPLFRDVQENWYRADQTLCGTREFLVQDPDGYLLRFSMEIGSKPVPEE